jgi:hypothetical protein
VAARLKGNPNMGSVIFMSSFEDIRSNLYKEGANLGPLSDENTAMNDAGDREYSLVFDSLWDGGKAIQMTSQPVNHPVMLQTLQVFNVDDDEDDAKLHSDAYSDDDDGDGMALHSDRRDTNSGGYGSGRSLSSHHDRNMDATNVAAPRFAAVDVVVKSFNFESGYKSPPKAIAVSIQFGSNKLLLESIGTASKHGSATFMEFADKVQHPRSSTFPSRKKILPSKLPFIQTFLPSSYSYFLPSNMSFLQTFGPWFEPPSKPSNLQSLRTSLRCRAKEKRWWET